MEKLTKDCLALLEEIVEVARKGFAVLGEQQMQSIIDHVVALKERAAVNEGALTHMYIPNDLGLAKAKNISPEKIRELIQSGEIQALDQAAECIIEFRIFHKAWLQMIVKRQIYEHEKVLQKEEDGKSSSPARQGFAHEVTIPPGQASTL